MAFAGGGKLQRTPPPGRYMAQTSGEHGDIYAVLTELEGNQSQESEPKDNVLSDTCSPISFRDSPHSATERCLIEGEVIEHNLGTYDRGTSQVPTLRQWKSSKHGSQGTLVDPMISGNIENETFQAISISRTPPRSPKTPQLPIGFNPIGLKINRIKQTRKEQGLDHLTTVAQAKLKKDANQNRDIEVEEITLTDVPHKEDAIQDQTSLGVLS